MFLPVPPQSPLPFERVVLPADYRLRNGLGAVGAAAALAQHSASACQWLCPLEQNVRRWPSWVPRVSPRGPS
jgi:hypothetical protein